jgi:hypothetical protein
MYRGLSLKPITQDRFKSDSKVNSLHLSALSIEEPKPRGDSNPKISILTLIADSSRLRLHL